MRASWLFDQELEILLYPLLERFHLSVRDHELALAVEDCLLIEMPAPVQAISVMAPFLFDLV